MTQKTPYIHRLAFLYACIVAAVPVIFNTVLVLSGKLVEYYGDDPGGSMKQRAMIFILPVLILVAIFHFKQKNNGFLKLKQGYVIGMEVAIMAVGIMIAYHAVFNLSLFPSFHRFYYETYGEQRFEELKECCDYTKEQFEAHKSQRLDYDKGKGYWGDLISTAFIGLLISTIGGLIMKKKSQ